MSGLLLRLAFTLAACGRHADALGHAARACELRPHDPRTWSDHGCILALFGDLCGAATRLDEHCAETWLALGTLLVDVGLPERALATFERAERLAALPALSITIPAVL